MKCLKCQNDTLIAFGIPIEYYGCTHCGYCQETDYIMDKTSIIKQIGIDIVIATKNKNQDEIRYYTSILYWLQKYHKKLLEK